MLEQVPDYPLPEPHARGDGPMPCPRPRPPSGRAPRTWGWTFCLPTSLGRTCPSPTHVGMDQKGVAPGGQQSRRAPRTWGWTAHQGRGPLRRRPSPTHVGMDRRSATPHSRSWTEPHARGDGPASRAGSRTRSTRAPRTWGWTAAPGSIRARYVPSPTHVGMDRVRVKSPSTPSPEPHARGDGPPFRVGRPEPRHRAPRTWGWTGKGHLGHEMARAEPHARGDGPFTPVNNTQSHFRAPRTWGWTAVRPSK